MNLLDLFRRKDNELIREYLPSSSLTPPPRKPVPSKGDYVNNVLNAYEKNVVVAGCVGIYASTLNEPPLVVWRNGAYDYSHPLSLLFKNPNPHQSQAEFWKMVWMYIGMGGGAYVVKVLNEYGIPVALYAYSYANMTETFSDEGWVSGYVYVNGQKETHFPVDRVVHLTHPLYSDPMKPHKGQSPISVAWTKIQMYNELDATTYALLANNAVLPGVFTAQGQIGSETVTSLKEQSRKVFKRNGKQETDPLVLGDGMTYTPMGLDATKLGSNELLRELETAICSAFRIHPSVVQTAAGLAASTYANLESAYKEFTTLTRQPFWNAIEEQMQSGFNVNYTDVDLEFDTSHVAALAADPDGNIYPTIAQFNGNLVTQNEARGSMGYPPLEDGDKFSFDVIPPAPAFGAFAADEPDDVKANKSDAVESYEEKDGKLKVIWEEKQAIHFWKSQDDIVQRAANQMQSHAADMFRAMQSQVIGKKRGAYNADVDIEGLLQAFMKATGSLRKTLFQEILKLATTSIGSDLTEVQSFIDKMRLDIEKEVTAKINESLGTAKSEISELLTEYTGKPQSVIKQRLLEKFDTLSNSRATAIANTTTKAQASATLNNTWVELDKRETKPSRKLYNVWLSRRDSKVRASHEKMDGAVVGVGAEFEFPDGSKRVAPALGNSAGEDINCRCTIRAVRASQLGRG